ncbi:hypothetical protein BC833DRAFT_71314 [Globomyces pollinis-pini]|nr:hypothetical protein BC833DRAFT_71314 [Globomyces pollinis-pini]
MYKKMDKVDIVIIGGGFSGLIALNKFIEEGYKNIVLISAEDLGTGQSLHNHGWLQHGYTMFPDLNSMEYVYQNTDKFLKLIPQNCIATAGECYISVPKYMARDSSKYFNQINLPFSIVDESQLPILVTGGGLTLDSTIIQAKNDCIILKQRALQHFANRFQNHIFKGQVKEIKLNSENICKLSVLLPNGNEYYLSTDMVVLAAGGGNQSLIQSISSVAVSKNILQQESKIFQSSRLFHMLCIRGPVELLPKVTFSSDVFFSSYVDEKANETVWIMHGPIELARNIHPFNQPLTQKHSVQNLLKDMFKSMPKLKSIVNDLKWGVFACYKSDGKTGYLPSVPNVGVLFPGLFSLTVNAIETLLVNIESKQIKPNDTVPDLDVLKDVVDVGDQNEDTVEYFDWNTFSRTYNFQ